MRDLTTRLFIVFFDATRSHCQGPGGNFCLRRVVPVVIVLLTALLVFDWFYPFCVKNNSKLTEIFPLEWNFGDNRLVVRNCLGIILDFVLVSLDLTVASSTQVRRMLGPWHKLLKHQYVIRTFRIMIVRFDWQIILDPTSHSAIYFNCATSWK